MMPPTADTHSEIASAAVDRISKQLKELAEDAESLRRLNASIKPLRIVRDKPRPNAKSLLVAATEDLNDAGEDIDAQRDTADGSFARSSQVSPPASLPTIATTPPVTHGPPEDERSPENERASGDEYNLEDTGRTRENDRHSRPSPQAQKRKRADSVPGSPRKHKSRNLSSTNLLTKANRQLRQRNVEAALRQPEPTATPDSREEIILAKWKPKLPLLGNAWSELMNMYPDSWPTDQRLAAIDEALFKADLLHPRRPLQDFASGLRAWVAQWVDTSQQQGGITVPAHLHGKKEFLEFWAMDRDVQTY